MGIVRYYSKSRENSLRHCTVQVQDPGSGPFISH